MRPQNHLDLEARARRRLHQIGVYEAHGAEQAEDHLSELLYGWWMGGAQWGDVDSSGDYIPTEEEDDAMSVVSQSTNASNDDWSDMSDGQRTPTQSSVAAYSRESTPSPDNGIDLARLSHLLDPRTPEDREEARLLARHLQNPGIMTRSQFRRAVERDRSEERRVGKECPV